MFREMLELIFFILKYASFPSLKQLQANYGKIKSK